MAGRWHPTRVLAWLLATACAAHAGEATEAASGAADQSKLMIGSMLISDYIYRGISYSAHQPSVATYIDAQQGWLYGYTNFNSVRFSTSPAVEVTMAVGARPTLGPFERVRYRRGLLLLSRRARAGAVQLLGGARDGIVQADRQDHAGTDAYSPNVWQTGAWGTYAAGTFSFDLPSELVPTDVGWTLSVDIGRWLFGPTSSGGGVSAAGGGLPLPDFTNWRAGLTFTYRVFKLGLNYTDTNLSKENCFIMTGDLGALPGGIANPGNNPFGLRSALCGATFSATLGFDINPAMLGP